MLFQRARLLFSPAPPFGWISLGVAALDNLHELVKVGDEPVRAVLDRLAHLDVAAQVAFER